MQIVPVKRFEVPTIFNLTCSSFYFLRLLYFNFRMTESDTSWEAEAVQEQINKQSKFCGWQLFHNDQDDSLRIKIGSVLHSRVSESGSTPNSLSLFSLEERDQIESVFQKIREIIPPPNEINFGCTFVTVYKDRKRNEEIILFRCNRPSAKKIFIEPNGRTYTGWDDFKKSNKIQNGCEYFAPSDGVYTADGQIQKIEKTNGRYFYTALIVAGLCVGVTLKIREIPTVLSVAMYLYGALQSVSAIRDRYKHKESSQNLETFFTYLTLITICLTQLCIAMVSYKEYFFQEFGIHWCKLVLSTINGTVLCLDAINFVISLSIFFSKAKTEKWSISDVFNLLLQAFLLYEQMINTIEFLELLSDTSYFRSFQKMTKSQKRNWKRRKSKENRRNGESKNNKIFEYQNDFFRFMKWFGREILSRCGEFFMKYIVQIIMTSAGAIAWRNIRRP